MCVSIPPKYAVSSVIGYIKGKSAISIARNFTGENFWARGYYVSTVGLDEEAVRKYIRDQEAEDTRLEQLNLIHDQAPSGGSHKYAPGSAGGSFNSRVYCERSLHCTA